MDKSAACDFYRFIFEYSMDAILLTRPDGSIHRANKAAEKMFQRSEAEMLAIGRAGLVDLSDPRLYDALYEREARGSVRAEINYVRKDGTIFPGDVTSALFQDELGQSWSAMIIRDVSGYKEIEQSLRQAVEEAEFYATHDYLTGILNRRIFLDQMLAELNRSQREQHPLGLLMIDVDHFKQINDSLGHCAGDQVLSEIAAVIQAALRPYDRFGRYGGDEFIVLLPATNRGDTFEIAERLRVAVEKLAVSFECEQTDPQIRTTISIGATSYRPDRLSTVSEIIARADRNLFAAKKIKNRIVID